MLGGGHYSLKWPDRSGWISGYVASIAAKELLTILVGADIWGECWRGCIVLCHW